jgi:CDP-diacylglycerol---serine O-phosphatidyltransferase
MNLLAGCMAILMSFHDVALGGLLIMLAGVFDFVDGLAARLLDAYSDIGKELDSLADIVSFGVAPSFILYRLFNMSIFSGDFGSGTGIHAATNTAILACAFMPAVFAAIRLAKFNVSAPGKDDFSGLPSPAAGIFIASAGYIVSTTGSLWLRELFFNTTFLVSISIILSVLMVIPLPMFSIKFSNFGLKDNKIRYLFVIPSFLLLIFIGLTAIPAILVYYILLSVVTASLLSKRASG